MKLLLRGHHLLCLKGFQGYGYSEEFIKNMIKINSLRKSENTIIKITDSPDDICKSCPNLKDNICKNLTQNQDIVNMDNEVLSKINKNIEYNAIELFEIVDHIFNSKESVRNICFNCRWHDECLFYQNL